MAFHLSDLGLSRRDSALLPESSRRVALSTVEFPPLSDEVSGSPTGFMSVQQSIAVPKRKDAELAYLRRPVEEAKVSGLVARAIEKTGARDKANAPHPALSLTGRGRALMPA